MPYLTYSRVIRMAERRRESNVERERNCARYVVVTRRGSDLYIAHNFVIRRETRVAKLGCIIIG